MAVAGSQSGFTDAAGRDMSWCTKMAVAGSQSGFTDAAGREKSWWTKMAVAGSQSGLTDVVGSTLIFIVGIISPVYKVFVNMLSIAKRHNL